MPYSSRMRSKLFVVSLVVLNICSLSLIAAEPNNPAAQVPVAASQIVGTLEVAGNASTPASNIIAKLRTRVGDIFSPQTATEDAKRIAELPSVDYAYYNTAVVDGKIKLTYVVVEKTLVRAIRFVGNKKYGPNALKKKIDFKRGDFLNRFLVETGKDALIKHYHEKGFAFVTIEVDPQDLATGIVTYKIVEGPRPKIKYIGFVGNKTIKSSELKKVIKTSKREWIIFQGYYQQQKVDEDVIKLLTAYQKHGHLDAAVNAAPEFSADKSTVRMIFTVVEGPIYTVDSVNVYGNTFFDTATLKSNLKLQPGAFYSQERADLDAKNILKRYKEIGFIDSTVTSKRNFVGGTKVAADFEVKEGDRFRIGSVNITGNEQTHDKVVRRVLDEQEFKPGEWYNADIAKGDGNGDLEKALKQNVMTESVFIKPTGNETGKRDAQVNVTEGQTGMVMLGAGVSSDAGIIGQIVFEQRNFDIADWPDDWSSFFHGQSFKGAGQRLRIALEPGTEVSQYSITFTEPYLMDKPISMDVGGLYYQRDRESYTETRTKGFVGFDKRYKEGWHQGITTRVENVKVSSVDSDAPKDVKDVAGDNFLTGVKYDFGRDTTDNKWNPTKGYLWDLAYEQVYVNDTFGVASATHRWYKTINEDLAERKTILGTKLQAADIIGNAPVFERFYAGGIGSMRGFEYRGVSTRGFPTFPGTKTEDTSARKKDPIGSNWIFLAGSEVSFPLASDTFQGLLFADSGTIDTGDYRVAVGTGIQILIPQWFGPVPMRFEFAVPVMKSTGDNSQIFSFSVGRLF